MPVPDFRRRWESTSIISLRRFAWSHIFRIQLFYGAPLRTEAELEQQFEKVITAIWKFAPTEALTKSDDWVRNELNAVSKSEDGMAYSMHSFSIITALV